MVSWPAEVPLEHAMRLLPDLAGGGDEAGSSALPTVFAALMLLSAAWPAGQAGLAWSHRRRWRSSRGVHPVAATAAVLLTGAALVLLAPRRCSPRARDWRRRLPGHPARRRPGRGRLHRPGAIGLIGFTLAGILATAVP